MRNGLKPMSQYFIITCDASKERSKCWYNRVPCLTVGQPRGAFITSRGRRMNEEEMMRLQGRDPSVYLQGDTTRREIGKLVGNSMSLNVAERILRSLFPAASFGKQ